jgi:hypothetical protein
VLGAPGTVILFGGTSVNDEVRSGVRLTLGGWLNDCQTLGVEGDFFMLLSRGTGFAASSAGDPILARPFFDVITGQPNAELISFPGLLVGSVSANAGSTGLLGADALLRAKLCCGCNSRLDMVRGYRYLRLSDHLGVDENLVTTSAASPNFVPLGTSIIVADRTIRGFLGARLLVVDETSRVSDALYPAVRPMLAVSRDRHQQPNAAADRRWQSLETIWWAKPTRGRS